MEETKTKITKLCKALRTVCKVVRVLSVVIICFMTVITIAMFFSDKVKQEFTAEFNGSLYEMLEDAAALDALPEKYRAMIAGFMSVITVSVVLIFIRFFENLLTQMINGEQPFTMEVAKKMRKISLPLWVLVVYDPIVATTAFLLARLFACLFEYGAYLQEKADLTTRIQEEMIISFAEITENKSGQTGQHIKRVAEYSRILAGEMGLSDEEIENVRLASTMHDIGKLLIPSAILEKPARLTDEEFAEIKKHSSYGGELLENVEGDIMHLARTIALDHHERYDGKGYPDGKTGEDISIEGRIVAVADVYDALTSKRSYKEAWDEQRAYDEIVKGSGTQFDAAVVEAFKKAYSKIDETRKKYADKNKKCY